MALLLSLAAPARAWTLADENAASKGEEYLEWFSFSQQPLKTDYESYLAWVNSDSMNINLFQTELFRPIVFVPVGTKVTLLQEKVSSQYRATEDVDLPLESGQTVDAFLARSFTSITISDTKLHRVAVFQQPSSNSVTVDEQAHTVTRAYSLYLVGVDSSGVPAGSFLDVPNGSYYYDAVEWAYQKELLDVAVGETVRTSTGLVTRRKTKPIEGKLFSPDQQTDRASLVLTLYRYYQSGISSDLSLSDPFTDVSGLSQELQSAIGWAYQTGVTKGNTATTFGPGQLCTRAQILTMLWRACGSPAADAAGVSQFDDVSPEDYFGAAVAWAVEEGVAKGTSSGQFSPNQTCTKAQMITFIYRALHA